MNSILCRTNVCVYRGKRQTTNRNYNGVARRKDYDDLCNRNYLNHYDDGARIDGTGLFLATYKHVLLDYRAASINAIPLVIALSPENNGCMRTIVQIYTLHYV